MLIRKENAEDTRSILSEVKQTKKPFVTSLVPVALCQLLIRISRVGTGKFKINLKFLADPPFYCTKLRLHLEAAKLGSACSSNPVSLARAARESREVPSQMPTKLAVVF